MKNGACKDTMLKIKVIAVGRPKEQWIESAISEYSQRLRGTMTVEWIWTASDAQQIKLVEQQNRVVCLDPQGKMLSSEEFSQFLFAELRQGGSSLCIVIGGAEGLPSVLRERYPLISFSRLTFTHQMVRLLLIEQLYRAVEIEKGSPYHK
jgi:23S rRNA (pseudouridine1915-N3)-methyltransferase